MPTPREAIYYGTNPIVRVGGDNTLSAIDHAVASAGVGRISGAGWPMGKLNQFGPNITWDVRMSHFVSRDTRSLLERFLARQRRDLFERCRGTPHDLFHSYRPGDYEWAALEQTSPDTESLTGSTIGIVQGGVNQSTVNVVLGDLSYWSDYEPKYGSWHIYNESNSAGYKHYVAAADSNCDWSTPNTGLFTFMGWVRQTGTASAQNILQRIQQYSVAFSGGQVAFSFGGSLATFSPVIPQGTNTWLFLAIRKPAGTTPELYYGFQGDTNLSGPFAPSSGSSGATVTAGSTNVLGIGNATTGTPRVAAGTDCFQGYIGPMVIADVALDASDIEAEFDRTKVGQVMFTDTGDWTTTYGHTPTKVMFWDMQRRIEFEALDNLMLTKQYNVFAGNSTPTNGAILLDHETLIDNIDSLFVDTALRDGLGDRLILGKLFQFTDEIGYLANTEAVWTRRKNVDLGTGLYNTRRIEIRPWAFPRTPPGGFRATHKNGQSILTKCVERFPQALPEDISPEEVTGAQRGRMRRVDYTFPCERFPFHDIDAQNYDDALDLQYVAYPP